MFTEVDPATHGLLKLIPKLDVEESLGNTFFFIKSNLKYCLQLLDQLIDFQVHFNLMMVACI